MNSRVLFSVWILLSSMFQNQAAAQISTADLLFGDRQFEQFLDDRIEPNRIVVPMELRNWIVRTFAIGNRGNRVYWEYDEPRSGGAAEHFFRHGEISSIAIRVTKSETYTSYDKLTCLVYEMFNLQQTLKTFKRDEELLRNRIIDSKIFARRCIKREYYAFMDTSALLNKVELRKLLNEKDTLAQSICDFKMPFDEFVESMEYSARNGGLDSILHFENMAEFFLESSIP
jgi:hypothetical protein